MELARASGARVFALATVSLLIAACDPGGAEGAGVGESESEGGTGTGGVEQAEPTDLCDVAPSVSTGVWAGTLRGNAKNLGGACGLGGPDAFVRVLPGHPADLRVEARGVGFVPRVGLLPSACVGGRELACTQGLALTLNDLPAGSEVIVAVGIDPDDPALSAGPPTEGQLDPLDFELEVFVRRILANGDYCQPSSLGRCGTGSACLADAADGGWRCEPLDGDTCAEADSLELPAETPMPIVLEVDPTRAQSDAHHHACTGARMRERVVRLTLSPEMSPTADLVVRVADPGVGLALRSPGCAADHEIACAAPGPGTSAIFPNAGEAAAAGVQPFVFVELPEPPPEGDPADPIEVTFEVVDG